MRNKMIIIAVWLGIAAPIWYVKAGTAYSDSEVNCQPAPQGCSLYSAVTDQANDGGGMYTATTDCWYKNLMNHGTATKGKCGNGGGLLIGPAGPGE